jgi:hypothetical protein
VLSLRNRPIALAPKSLNPLRLIAERRVRLPNTMSRCGILWPDTIVDEASPSSRDIAEGLGEDGSKWVATVPKHGYWLERSAGNSNDPHACRCAP